MQHNVNRGLATTPASTEIRLAFIHDITVSHPVRTHPLQLLLADVLDAYSQSSTLAGIFSQRGVTAGHNTYNGEHSKREGHSRPAAPCIHAECERGVCGQNRQRYPGNKCSARMPAEGYVAHQSNM